MSKGPYQSISIHPAITEDDSPSIDRYEVWETHEEVLKGKSFDSDGVMAWLYPIDNGGATSWVWMNEAGHPTRIFTEGADLQRYLESLAPIVTWVSTART